VGFYCKLRRRRDNDFLAIRRKDLHMCFEIAVAYPVIHDCELQKSRRKDLEEDILKQAHERKLVAHFDPVVVARDRINKLCRLHGFTPRNRSSNRLWILSKPPLDMMTT